MLLFRALLIAIFVTLTSYTAIVVMNQGINLLPIFFGDIARLAWPGQFNLDFLFMLTLSSLWVLWRHRFSRAGWALSVGALLGGSLFLSVYLLIESGRANGDVRQLLCGDQA